MGFKEKLTIFDVIFFKIKPNFQPIFCNYFTNDYSNRKLEALIEQTIRYVWNNNPPRLVHKNWYL